MFLTLTIPMSTSFSTTGSLSMPFFTTSSHASSTDVSGAIVIKGEDIISCAFTSLAFLSFNRTFNAKSRSVIIPAGLPSFVITTLPIPSSATSFAILVTKTASSSVMIGRVIISLTCIKSTRLCGYSVPSRGFTPSHTYSANS